MFPSVVLFLFIAAYQTVDGIFIEKYAGDIAIASVNLFSPILYLFLGLGIMLGSGSNALIVKYIGANRQADADRVFTHSSVLALILSVGLSAACLILTEPMMKWLGSSPNNCVYLKQYYIVMCIGTVAILLQSTIGLLLIGEGKMVLAAVVGMAGGVLNCILDYLFMAVFQWGVTGAAIATVLGYMVSVVAAVYYYVTARKSNYHFVRAKVNVKEMALVCYNGASELVSNLAAVVTALIMNHLMLKHAGELGQSALSVVLYFQFFLMSIFMGMNSAVDPVFSFHYGSGEIEPRKNAFRLCMIWIGVFSLLSTLVIVFLNRPLAALFFDPESGALYEMTRIGLKMCVLASVFTGFNIFVSGLFTAFNNGTVSAVLSALRTLFVLTLMMFLLSAIWQTDGLWFAWSAAEAVTAVFSIGALFLYRKRYQYM